MAFLSAELPAARSPNRLPSISELNLHGPQTPVPSPTSLYTPNNETKEEDCAKILTSLSITPAGKDDSVDRNRTLPTLPPLSQLLNGPSPFPPPSAMLIRRGSSDSVSSLSSLPSLASSASTLPSPTLSPRTPVSFSAAHFPSHGMQYMVPPKFADLSLIEQRLAEAMAYDTRRTRPGGCLRPGSVSQNIAKPTTTALSSPSSPLRRKRAPPKASDRPHINIKYSDEQNHFIMYHKADLGLSWKDVQKAYVARYGASLDRTAQGLQTTLYRRDDKTPLTTPDGLLYLYEPDGSSRCGDEESESYGGVAFRTAKAKSRDVGGRRPLVERYAEQVADAGYDWIQPHHMAEARRIGALRKRQRQEYLRARKLREKRLYHL